MKNSDKFSQIDVNKIFSINGPIIKVYGLKNPSLGDMVEIGLNSRLIGEIIKLERNIAIIQCYEETAGLELNDTVFNLNYPLSMELGPGILNTIFDGIQRPLQKIPQKSGDFIENGIKIPSLDRSILWDFIPEKKVGDFVSEGDIMGTVKEGSIDHKILVPPFISGKIELIQNGKLKIDDTAYTLKIKKTDKNQKFTLIQRWPIKQPRPYQQRYISKIPLITGTRVIDLLFPIAAGGAVAVPGGFGTGKTIVQQTLAKFAHADIIVYIGCGERGNEMAELLERISCFGRSPISSSIIRTNRYNREYQQYASIYTRASIFSGITIAEYWRDQGKNVLLLADSTSRWAEALRELSGRLEEMPTEGGYPAYLSTLLSNFYERAGYVKTLGAPERNGSITIVGAVSPPSGDFSEPVTKTTKRFVKAFWALDSKLAYARHYPSINWTESYSLFDGLDKYWDEEIEEGWQDSRLDTNVILAKAAELEKITQLIGAENVTPEQQLTIFISDIIKNSFLIQNAYDLVDRYSTPQKTLKMIKIILKFYNGSMFLIKKGVPLFKIKEMECLNQIQRMRLDIKNEELDRFNELIQLIAQNILQIQNDYSEMF